MSARCCVSAATSNRVAGRADARRLHAQEVNGGSSAVARGVIKLRPFWSPVFTPAGGTLTRAGSYGLLDRLVDRSR